MKISFLGAAGEVTGSKHLIQTENYNLLLDCGLHQGRRQEANALNANMPFPSKSVNAVILSHGHLDHCGMLPVLVKQGFRGDIFATTATADIAHYIMADSARIQEQDARYFNNNLPDDGKPIDPLYTEEDALAVQSYFKPTPYFRLKPHWTQVNPKIRFKFLDAGHILGSALTVVEITEGGVTKRIGYTGDIGKPGNPLLHDPEPFREPLDALIMESTYGNRDHRSLDVAEKVLVETIKEAAAKKSKVIIPAFALGRTQQLIYSLHRLTDEGHIPRMPIYVDSPLGLNITEVFQRHPEDLNASAWQGFTKDHENPFLFRNLDYVESVDESRALNDLPGPFMVIASSGMCEGGRVLHHLMHHISDPNAVIMITGYQGKHTLGRKIQDGVSPVKIFGRPYKVRAKVITLDEFSAHADKTALMTYLSHIPTPKQIFLVHGETDQSEALQSELQKKYPGAAVHVPMLGDNFDV